MQGVNSPPSDISAERCFTSAGIYAERVGRSDRHAIVVEFVFLVVATIAGAEILSGGVRDRLSPVNQRGFPNAAREARRRGADHPRLHGRIGAIIQSTACGGGEHQPPSAYRHFVRPVRQAAGRQGMPMRSQPSGFSPHARFRVARRARRGATIPPRRGDQPRPNAGLSSFRTYSRQTPLHYGSGQHTCRETVSR